MPKQSLPQPCFAPTKTTLLRGRRETHLAGKPRRSAAYAFPHLIAAAPDMYKALERLWLAYQGGTAARSVQQQREDAAFAAATLAKAKGESSEIRQVSGTNTKVQTLTKQK